MNKIKKGDTVVVLSGSAKKTVSEVLRVIPKEGKIIVKGVNTKTSVKKTGNEKKLVTREYPIDASNVAIADGKSKTPSRVGFKVEGDKLVRYAKKSGSIIK
jgi:large subunit ribosomal protein L24